MTPTLRQPFYASLLAVPITTAAACSGVQTPATTMRMRACGFRVERPVTAPEPQEKHSGLTSVSKCLPCARQVCEDCGAQHMRDFPCERIDATARDHYTGTAAPLPITTSHARPLGNSERCDSV